MTGPALRVAVLGLAAAAVLPASRARAQVRLGLDATFATRYVWRGVSRTREPVVQLQTYGALSRGRGWWTAGGWANLEPWRPDLGDPSVAGVRGPRFGEWNVWLQRDFVGGGLALSVGAAVYGFRGDAASGGLSDSLTTGELYLRASDFAGIRVVSPTIFLAYDPWRVDGAYLELELHRRIPLLPVTPFRMLEGGLAVGFNLGQRRTATDPEGYFASNGFTHLDLSLGTAPRLRLGPVPLTIAVVGHWQFALDDATRRPVSSGGAPRSTWWLATTLSLASARDEQETE
ncbi:MAG TPA: hypothetical protein VFU46_13515 [Gemmatimonadales bacterium]|nr:hypothetical protein [Gemmatimonadales bacterium]